MNNPILYRAFGMTISSEFPINQLVETYDVKPDVWVVRRDLSGFETGGISGRQSEGEILFTGIDQSRFRITDGALIEVDPVQDYNESYLGVFIMGSCMGAILHQRGFMPIHGSCVTDGVHSILITGDSGAGKSTLAAEFLSKGWKLITDDVTAIFDLDGRPMVQSSYPSQKLWDDSRKRYESEARTVHSLYTSADREKFGVNVTSSFFDGTCPLSMIVRLVAGDRPCAITPIKGMVKTDQLLRNTYRLRMIEPGNVQRHFQRCVTLSTKIPMALVIRENGKQCADTLYSMITDYLGGLNNE